MTLSVLPVENIGVRIILTVTENGIAKNISTATKKKIILRNAGSSSKVVKDATFLTDGSDGKVYYDLLAGDVSTAGTWSAQVYFEMGTFKGFTQPQEIFTGVANLAQASEV
jgi:hypothetical protein